MSGAVWVWRGAVGGMGSGRTLRGPSFTSSSSESKKEAPLLYAVPASFPFSF